MYDFHTDAKLLWEYHHLNQPLQKADCILGFGSHDLHVADFLNILVGDLQRIDLYGRNGFQIPQEIPPDVWAAYRRLVNAGFDKQLIAGCL